MLILKILKPLSSYCTKIKSIFYNIKGTDYAICIKIYYLFFNINLSDSG